MPAPSPTVNGLRLLAASITETLVGAWIADIEHDGTEALSGAVTIILDGETWRGTATSSKPEAGRVKSRIVGGAAGLSTELPAKSYSSPSGALTLATVLADVLRESGETLSSSASAPTTALANWVRSIGTAAAALKAIAEKSGQTWRVMRDGTLWIGSETWPAWAPVTPPIEIDTDWSDGNVELRDAITIRPGLTYQDHQIQQVVHEYRGGGTKTTASKEAASGALDKLLGAVRREVDYRTVWPGKVTRQNSDGTVEVVCDDARISGSGIDRVPLAPGIPGATITVPADARGCLFFAGGDPSRPRFSDWDYATAVTLISIGGGGADFVALAGKVDTLIGDLKTWLNAHTHPTGVGPSGPPTAPGWQIAPGQPASVAATKLKTV